jgi:AcrR family transcriptional regulator
VPEERDERAGRILDAAAALIVRLGYGKTTIDDIARRAGIAKGTVYLHWKSRDALFVALLRRERVLLLTDARTRLASAPGGPAPRTLIESLAVALTRRPLLRAVLVRDLDVIGRLAHDHHGAARTGAGTGAGAGGGTGGGAGDDGAAVEALRGYLDELRRAGAVRDDLDAGALLTIVASTFTGFFFTPWLRGDMARADDEMAALLADTIDRALAPARGAREHRAPVAEATTRFLDASLDLAERKLAAVLTPPARAGKSTSR